MASTVKEMVKVDALSKFGFKSGAEYLNWSKNIKDSEKGKVVPGGTFEMELYVADSGKKYVNSVATSATASAAAPKPAVKVEVKAAPTAAPKATSSESMSKAEWSAKDRSQLIGGLSHDSAAITAALIAVSSVPEPLALYKELLLGMLKIRDEVR